MRSRTPWTLAAAGFALAAGIVAQAAGASVASGAWAFLAGLGVTLMLRGAGLRVLAGLLVVLGAGSALWAHRSGLAISGAAFALAAAAAGALAVLVRPRPADAAAPRRLDPWQAMDAGEDPTL